MTSTPRKPSPGFSLIELMVVISIIIIMAAAAIPMGLNYVKHYKITGAAQGIQAEVQRARAQAVKRNTSRGILLNFNYPEAGQYQFTSLDPNPWTGNWDSPAYPANPGVFNGTTVNYGTVPVPPDNVLDPDPDRGIQSPHGIPINLPQDVQFVGGERNALLFRADGSVVAVNAGGPTGGAALTRDANDWIITLRDPTTNLTRIVRVSPGGRVTMDTP